MSFCYVFISFYHLEPISKLFEVLDTRVRHYSHSDFMMRTSKDTLGHYHSSRMTKGDVTTKPGGGGGTPPDMVYPGPAAGQGMSFGLFAQNRAGI